MNRYYDSEATIDSINVDDVVLTKWDGTGMDTSAPWRVATVVDKGVDETYAGGGWVRMSIGGKNTVKVSVQWAVMDIGNVYPEVE